MELPLEEKREVGHSGENFVKIERCIPVEGRRVIQVKMFLQQRCIPMEGTRVVSGSKWTGINKEATKPYLCIIK